MTDDVERRVEQHNDGVSKWTKRFKGWTLLKTWQFPTLGEARKQENYLKRLKGGNEFHTLLNGSSGS